MYRSAAAITIVLTEMILWMRNVLLDEKSAGNGGEPIPDAGIASGMGALVGTMFYRSAVMPGVGILLASGVQPGRGHHRADRQVLALVYITVLGW